MTWWHLQAEALKLYKGSAQRMRHDREAIRKLPYGHVIETERVMLWGFPVNPPGPYKIEHHRGGDTWLVWLCVGDLAEVVDAIPWPLPSITFARDNGNLRTYDYHRLVSKLKHLQR